MKDNKEVQIKTKQVKKLTEKLKLLDEEIERKKDIANLTSSIITIEKAMTELQEIVLVLLATGDNKKDVKNVEYLIGYD